MGLAMILFVILALFSILSLVLLVALFFDEKGANFEFKEVSDESKK